MSRAGNLRDAENDRSTFINQIKVSKILTSSQWFVMQNVEKEK